MKNLFFISLFFIIVSCANNKGTYWCGDHPCINKKEREAYFKKTMIVEIKDLKSDKSKNNSGIERIIKQAKLDEKKRIKNKKDLAKQAKLEEKRLIKEEKYLVKKARLEEKRRIKEEKDLAKQIRLDEKRRIKEEKSHLEKKLLKIKTNNLKKILN